MRHLITIVFLKIFIKSAKIVLLIVGLIWHPIQVKTLTDDCTTQTDYFYWLIANCMYVCMNRPIYAFVCLFV